MKARSASTTASASTIAAMMQDPAVRSALVIAHPAHEVRVYDWMTMSKPRTYMLTTGSRHGDDRTRFEASCEIVRNVGATLVRGWGGVQDRLVYSWLLSKQWVRFLELTSGLVDEFVSNETEIVVTDSWQLYNVAHDLTHVMTRAAAKLAASKLGRSIPVVDYPVVPRALAPQAPLGEMVLRLEVPPALYRNKRAAMERIPLITLEVEQILREEGDEALRTETYALPGQFSIEALTPSFVPYYECYGEQRVCSGLYQEVIRWTHAHDAVRAVMDLSA